MTAKTATKTRADHSAPARGDEAHTVVQYQCRTCFHDWRGHSKITKCPKCQSIDLMRLEAMSTVEAGRRHLNGHQPAGLLEKPSKTKAKGKTKVWPSGLDNLGTPTWICPACNFAHEGSVCPSQCRECGEPGNPKQSFAKTAEAGLFTLEQIEAAREKPARSETKPPAGGTPAAGNELLHWLEPRAICPHPDNPRKHFDGAKLEELAEGFKKAGVINPLTVRSMGHETYQLVAGERRLRAAVIANLKTVPCRIVDITDEEAYEVMIRENIDREDLDEIERARSYKLGIEKCGLTQETFAKRYNRSQEHVSNTIRLLGLPEAWQQRLIQRQITATHARELLTWLDLPKVLEKVEKRFDAKNVPSAAEFRRSLVDVARESSRSMVFSSYSYGNFCAFKPTAAQKKELDIRLVPQSWGGKERRAFNTRLWSELNTAAKKRRKDNEKQQIDRTNAARGGGDVGKIAAKNAARQAAEAKRQGFLQDLWLYKRNWTAAQIGEKLKPEHTTLLAKTAVLMLMGAEEGVFQDDRTWKSIDLKFDRWDQDKNAAQVAPLTPAAADAALYRVVRAYLAQQQEENYGEAVPPAFLGTVAKTLHVDLAKEWKPDVAFLALHDEGELAELVESWPDPPAAPVNDAQEILAAWPKGFVPEDLLWVDENGRVKSPKGAAKKKAGKKAKAKR